MVSLILIFAVLASAVPAIRAGGEVEYEDEESAEIVTPCCPGQCKQTCDRPNYKPPKECASNPACFYCPAGYVFLNADSNDCVKISDCPKDEPCPGNCKQTCDRPNYKPPRECASNPACFYCPAGYVFLNADSNDCVKISDCPKDEPCPGNCKQTCDRPNYKPPRECASKPACFYCPAGYVFLNADSNDCVKISDCPKDEPCPGNCKQTCDRPNYKPPRECASNPACFYCPAGYVFLNADSNDCVKISDCPSASCNGDPNAHEEPPISACPPTCDNPHPKCQKELFKGCVCNSGYILDKPGGKCVKIKDCTCKSCKGDPNAHIEYYVTACPPTCDNPHPNCNKEKLFGCVCNPGYILDKPGGKCIKQKDCPCDSCNGDPNAHEESPVKVCQPTCDNPNPNYFNITCQKEFFKGCVCNLGYILDKPGGKCIKIKDCPCKSCNGDPNAHVESPVSACPPTCDNPHPNCQKELFIGCVCNPGYILDKPGGKCIKQKDCPCDSCNGDPNAHEESPVSACPPTCDNPHPKCQKELFKGCVCNAGYILDKPGGKCVKIKDCTCKSCNGDPNAHIEYHVTACPPTCDNPHPNCNKEKLLGCVCNPGYFLDKPGGNCIKQKDCPCASCNGDPNAHEESPVSACPPTCDNPHPNCQKEFFKGCVCNAGYVLDKPVGKCIKQKDCPCNCGPNEVVDPCPPFCWTDKCSDLPRRGVPCETLLPIECVPACQCKDGYARDDYGNCIPIDQCPC